MQSDGYEFEVPKDVQTVVPDCNHNHQKLVGNELRCAGCDALLQVTGIIGKTVTAQQAEWAQKAAEGTPDGPNREDA